MQTRVWLALLAAGPALFPAIAGSAWDEVTCGRYPDADAVLVDDISKVRYNPDGTYEETGESWTKVLTEKGRREESTVTLRYSRRYGSAEILYLGVIGTNGVERTVDTAATTKESTDNSSMGMNIYDPLDRVVVSTVPGLKVGETVHLKTVRRAEKPRCRGVWSDVSVFEWSCPIVRSELEITAPAGRPLRKVAVRNPLGNVTRSERTLADGSTVHVFVCTNSPQAFPEPDMPALHTVVQHLRVSTAESWPEISRWYWELCRGHIERATPEMTNTVAALVKGLESDDERMRAVFKFVSQEVRYMGLTMEDTSPGYAPHDVDVTFARRHGVCRDKAALLVAMLRIAGLEAYPVLIHVGEKRDAEVPQPFFNHAIVGVARSGGEAPPGEDDRYVLMDPTNESSKDLMPAYESDRSYLVARPDGEDLRTSPTPSPEHNAVRVASHANLDESGSMFLESVVCFDGINDTAYRSALLKARPEDRIKFFERAVKREAAGARLVKCSIEPKDLRDTKTPLRATLAACIPEALLRGETRNELLVPYLSRTFGMANFLLEGNTSLETRRFPLKLDSTASVDETLEIETGLPDGIETELPDDVRIDGAYGYHRAISFTNGVLRARRRAYVSKVELLPGEYSRLREDIKRVEAAERRAPAFARDRISGANVRWIFKDCDVHIHSDRAWTSTNRVVKEILTQEGKHRSAELKFRFNPRVESVELVSAVVSNRDGKVRFVSAREMNVMDCSWAASAPRYPASKILVANLPAVEIGSTISYTVVSSVTNSPLPYYGVFDFDSLDPLERCRVRVNGWTRDEKSPRRVPNEPGQPSPSLWRDRVIVSSNRFARFDFAVGEIPSGEVPEMERDVKAIRDWMARNVKIAGPGAWELPLDMHLTSPATVLKERYASRLDYVRTLCALLRGAGFDADVVLAAADAGEPDEVRERIMRTKPNVSAFSSPLCRVTLREGGFFGFGARRRELFLGTESEYAPLGVCGMEGCDYFDPVACSFGKVGVPDPKFMDGSDETCEIDVRGNGAVDMTVETTIWGSGVGAFRKRYAEILPEDRMRRHQSILGGISQAATATSELETDIASYPATRKFSCFIPDYATVDGDTMTLLLPSALSEIPTFAGGARRTPFAVGAAERETETVRVLFPEGYTEIEHMPRPFSFADPADTNRLWLVSEVSSEVKGDRLEVVLRREVFRRGESWYAPDFIEMVKDRSRIAASRANRTIIVRRR